MKSRDTQHCAREISTRASLEHRIRRYAQQREHPSRHDQQTAEVRETSGGEDVAALVALVISPGIRIMQEVIVLRLVDGQVGAPGRGVRREGVLDERPSRDGL